MKIILRVAFSNVRINIQSLVIANINRSGECVYCTQSRDSHRLLKLGWIVSSRLYVLQYVYCIFNLYVFFL